MRAGILDHRKIVGGIDDDSITSLNRSALLGRAANILVRSGGTVLITEVPEFCGAEHVLANRQRFEHVRRVASGEIHTRAEEHKHREFQFWAEQTVSL